MILFKWYFNLKELEKLNSLESVINEDIEKIKEQG